MDIKKVAVIIGCRPDVIKQWSPYVNLKKNFNLDIVLVHSGQHDELGIQARQVFNLHPDYTCRILDDDKYHLATLISRLIDQFTIAFYELKPDLVLVHGDTSTAFSAAIAAFLQNIKIGHVEAGLRTSRFESPFPEEGFRRAISRFTTLHFAPTPKSAQNLREEGINEGIHVTGNTVVDALNHVLSYPESFTVSDIRHWIGQDWCILVTAHRRESYGEPLINLCNSLKTIANSYPYVKIIWPVHTNTNINDTVVKHLSHERIMLSSPLNYHDFVKLLKLSNLVITDSGGVMEEAAVLGKSTLVLRDETERPEVLDLDSVKLVGYNFKELEELAVEWLETPKLNIQSNAFGFGHAGEEIAEIIGKYYHGNVYQTS